VATETKRTRCRDRLAALSESDLTSAEMRLEAIGVLRGAIGFDRWCWPLADPGAALHLTGIGHLDNWQALPRMILLEQSQDPFNAMPRLAEGPHHGGVLSIATGRDLARSPRWDEGMRPFGIGDELRVALVDDRGMWGFIDMLRDQSDRAFQPEDLQLVVDLAPLLATSIRQRSIQEPDSSAPAPPVGTGVVLLDEDLRIRSWTSAARGWVEALAPAGQGAEAMIYGLAGRLLALKKGVALHPANRVRVRTLSGHWGIIEGGELLGAHTNAIVVTIRPASPREVFDLVCAAHFLTARESEVVTLLIEGRDTRALTKGLSISRHTVQDHFKSIFAKTNVRSRRQLVAKFTDGVVA
jgi:DNA-binding CsgD family transcriptional regulator